MSKVSFEERFRGIKSTLSKSICFLTGVPGAGKTLAGLNIANERRKAHEDENAVFLSGNGPLVYVLREALVRDEIEKLRHVSHEPGPITEEEQKRIMEHIDELFDQRPWKDEKGPSTSGGTQ